MYINNLGHMAKMAAMPIYGKNPSKSSLKPIERKVGVKQQWLKYSNVYINHDLDQVYGKVNMGCLCI